MKIKIIKGDLIRLAQEGQFDVIGHGCNCFCAMKRGIAPLMHEAFGCNDPEVFSMENKYYQGDIKKLGQIQAAVCKRRKEEGVDLKNVSANAVIVVNMYTQYHWNNPSSKYGVPLDEDALRLCLRKMNHQYKGKHIGLPGLIGCGLAGGNSKRVIDMLNEELADCEVTVVFIDETKIPNFLSLDHVQL